MNGVCEKCKNPILEPGDDTASVTYSQWKSVIEEKNCKRREEDFQDNKKGCSFKYSKRIKIGFY